jgi:hypothetical protein
VLPGRFHVRTVSAIVASLGVLWKLSAEISWAELQAAFTAVAATQLTEAFLFVAVSYLFLTCYRSSSGSSPR